MQENSISGAVFKAFRRRRDHRFIQALKPRILSLLRERGTLTLGQINNRLRASKESLWYAVQNLRAEGAIEVERKQKNNGDGHYYLVTLRRRGP